MAAWTLALLMLVMRRHAFFRKAGAVMSCSGAAKERAPEECNLTVILPSKESSLRAKVMSLYTPAWRMVAASSVSHTTTWIHSPPPGYLSVYPTALQHLAYTATHTHAHSAMGTTAEKRNRDSITLGGFDELDRGRNTNPIDIRVWAVYGGTTPKGGAWLRCTGSDAAGFLGSIVCDSSIIERARPYLTVGIHL